MDPAVHITNASHCDVGHVLYPGHIQAPAAAVFQLLLRPIASVSWEHAEPRFSHTAEQPCSAPQHSCCQFGLSNRSTEDNQPTLFSSSTKQCACTTHTGDTDAFFWDFNKATQSHVGMSRKPILPYHISTHFSTVPYQGCNSSRFVRGSIFIGPLVF